MKLILTTEQVRQGVKAAGPLFPVCKSRTPALDYLDLAMSLDTCADRKLCCYRVNLCGLHTHRALRACVRLVHLHLTAGWVDKLLQSAGESEWGQVDNCC